MVKLRDIRVAPPEGQDGQGQGTTLNRQCSQLHTGCMIECDGHAASEEAAELRTDVIVRTETEGEGGEWSVHKQGEAAEVMAVLARAAQVHKRQRAYRWAERTTARRRHTRGVEAAQRVDNDSNTVTLSAHKFGENPHKRATLFRQMCKSGSASVQIRFRKCANWVRRIPFKCTDRIHQMQSASEYCSPARGQERNGRGDVRDCPATECSRRSTGART